MIMQQKYFYDSLNIAVIVAPCDDVHKEHCEMFPIFFSIYRTKLIDGYFSCGNVIIHFWDKSYQEINFECHSNTLVLCK